MTCSTSWPRAGLRRSLTPGHWCLARVTSRYYTAACCTRGATCLRNTFTVPVRDCIASQVARYLTERLGDGFDGCVYLDPENSARVFRPDGQAPLLSESDIPLHRRFVFYDQVHTTGVDIKHAIDACAVVTLGKDMTSRDYFQGGLRALLVRDVYHWALTRHTAWSSTRVLAHAWHWQGPNCRRAPVP